MEAIINSSLWRLASWLPGFILRWFFSPEWLDSKVTIEIRARHQNVEIKQPSDPHVVIWLEITNRGHFELKLDRVVTQFFYGIEMCSPMSLKREVIPPGESKTIYLTAPIPSARYESLRFQYKHNNHAVRLELFAEFESKLHNFRSERSLDGIQPKIMNESQLSEEAANK